MAHADFGALKLNRQQGLTPDDGTFRLQPITAKATRTLEDCADVSFTWSAQALARPRLTWEAPGQTSWPYTFATSAGGTLRLVGCWRDGDGNLVSYSVRIVAPGGAVTVPLATAAANKSEARFDLSLSCSAPGTYRIIASAVDADGLSEEVTVEATVPPGLGHRRSADR